MDYDDFLSAKALVARPAGFDIPAEVLHPAHFPFARDIVRWALRRGRAALFENCGLGKTIQQLDWSHQVHLQTQGDALILAPLAVSGQTVNEGKKFGFTVTHCRSQEDVRPGINITNYEMLHRFNPSHFKAVVLDESSIVKNSGGKMRTMLIESFRDTPYRLACSATPAPNDVTEMGNHAEFIGIMSDVEMKAMFFTHDGGDTSQWVLKGHAATGKYYKWLASWAVMIHKPSDLGYGDGNFVLPPLSLHHHVVATSMEEAWDAGVLFPAEARDMNARRTARRVSMAGRVGEMVKLVAADPEEMWLIWCDLNAEGDALEKAIPDAVQVAGSDKPEHKEWAMQAFARGEIKVLVSKPGICGYGMNFQRCARIGFVGLSDSWEAYYQAIRRVWRFGQTRLVECHVVTAETEGAVVANIERKEQQAMVMQDEMVRHMADISALDIRGATREVSDYARETATGDGWELYLGDCVEVTRGLPDSSVGFTIYSPPFSSLYVYSNSDRDMGNCRDDSEFYQHFDFLAGEMMRVTMPGRLMSFHCMSLPLSKERDGVIGLRDFRGQLIRLFEAHGWIFHSEVCIWKDPVTAMQRTKALGLLHKQVVKDSAMSRQGIPDYLVTMRKPGVNPVPVFGALSSYAGDLPAPTRLYTKSDDARNGHSIEIWQRYASPVWMDIRPSRTLQKESAREAEDGRHICPLQLDVIERAVQLWSMPGDVVFSPFAGIGSEGHVALKMGRRFIGAELKRSYWEVAVRNLTIAAKGQQGGLFAELFDDDHVQDQIQEDEEQREDEAFSLA